MEGGKESYPSPGLASSPYSRAPLIDFRVFSCRSSLLSAARSTPIALLSELLHCAAEFLIACEHQSLLEPSSLSDDEDLGGGGGVSRVTEALVLIPEGLRADCALALAALPSATPAGIEAVYGSLTAASAEHEPPASGAEALAISVAGASAAELERRRLLRWLAASRYCTHYDAALERVRLVYVSSLRDAVAVLARMHHGVRLAELLPPPPMPLPLPSAQHRSASAPLRPDSSPAAMSAPLMPPPRLTLELYSAGASAPPLSMHTGSAAPVADAALRGGGGGSGQWERPSGYGGSARSAPAAAQTAVGGSAAVCAAYCPALLAIHGLDLLLLGAQDGHIGGGGGGGGGVTSLGGLEQAELPLDAAANPLLSIGVAARLLAVAADALQFVTSLWRSLETHIAAAGAAPAAAARAAAAPAAAAHAAAPAALRAPLSPVLTPVMLVSLLHGSGMTADSPAPRHSRVPLGLDSSVAGAGAGRLGRARAEPLRRGAAAASPLQAAEAASAAASSAAAAASSAATVAAAPSQSGLALSTLHALLSRLGARSIVIEMD